MRLKGVVAVTVKGLPRWDPEDPTVVALEQQLTDKIGQMVRAYGETACGH